MNRSLRVGERYALSKRKPKYIKLRYISLLAVLTSMCLYARAQRLESSGPAPMGIDTTYNARDTIAIEEVEVNTGYQRIPKERATGSFTFLDSMLLNRRVSMNLLDRLDGVSSGLVFHRPAVGNSSMISVRGRSTIQANPEPLIVVDNFPYEGNPANINPQDVESVTILKDAAAASVWGTRAGNGVIVIRTKQGSFNLKPRIAVSSNLTVGGKPDLWHLQQLSNKEYIEVERFLFDHGRYDGLIATEYSALSPVVEQLVEYRSGAINESYLNAVLDSIAQHDNRTERSKYFYRNSLHQQHRLDLQGGGSHHKYYVSIGYDRSLPNAKEVSDERLVLNANNTINAFDDRVQLSTGMTLTMNNSKNSLVAGYNPRYPYERLADGKGNALPVTDGILRHSYIDTAGGGALLDWHYRPLDELREGYYTNRLRGTDYRLNARAVWRVAPGMSLTGLYTFQRGTDEQNSHSLEASYNTRNRINELSQIDVISGEVFRPIPRGDILNSTHSVYTAHYARMQLGYDRQVSENLSLTSMLGYEVNDYHRNLSTGILYGYDPETGNNLNSAIDYTVEYPYYYRASLTRIPEGSTRHWNVDRYLSYYGNASLSFRGVYIVSGSFRKDRSNIFGVRSNQRGVSLWSAGLLWNVAKERFYDFEAIPDLRLRLTYGYNGNVDKATAAYLTASTARTTNLWGGMFLNIENPPNPSLRWERVENINLALDFALWRRRITGSIEYWKKNGTDLIGSAPIAGQSGVTVFRGNSADIASRGIDLTVASRNISGNGWAWNTTLLVNTVSDIVKTYKAALPNNNTIVNSNYRSPREGFPYYSAFAYRYLGLDSLGNPIGMIDGTPSQNYAQILSSLMPEDLVYAGTFQPRFSGGLLNMFNWKGIGLSFNLTYKAGFVYRRASLNGLYLYQPTPDFIQPDYRRRWQHPGDEAITSVPRLQYPANGLRDALYTNSELLMERGDHIRIQDIRLDYTVRPSGGSLLPFTAMHFYTYMFNVGILWKASKTADDPDAPNSIPPVRTFTVGVKLDI